MNKNRSLKSHQQFEMKDISVVLGHDLPCWPQSSGIRLERVKRLKVDGCNSSIIHCDAHAGTHVDAPLHHIAQGADVSEMSLETLCGLTYVGHCPHVQIIGPAELEQAEIPSSCTRLLLCTSNSKLWKKSGNKFHQDFVALSQEGANWIVNRKFALIGLDYLSIQPFKEEPEVHAILFTGGVTIIEGIDLSGVDKGWWELFCLPLRIQGAEASPARTILRRPVPNVTMYKK